MDALRRWCPHCSFNTWDARNFLDYLRCHKSCRVLCKSEFCSYMNEEALSHSQMIPFSFHTSVILIYRGGMLLFINRVPLVCFKFEIQKRLSGFSIFFSCVTLVWSWWKHWHFNTYKISNAWIYLWDPFPLENASLLVNFWVDWVSFEKISYTT